MRVVSRFEADLLRILHAILRRAPVETAANLIRKGQAQPHCLSADAVALVKDALAKGCVQLLAQVGGWQSERFLREGKAAPGRLWHRTAPAELGLEFSRGTLEFLIWLTAAAWEKEAFTLACQAKASTVADELLLMLTFDLLQRQEFMPYLRALSLFRRSPLLWLCFPDLLAGQRLPRLNWEKWTTGLGACILEAWQNRLASRWLEMERQKGLLVDGQQMRRLGTTQETILAGFLTALDKAGRWDLARFLLRTLEHLLRSGTTAQAWVGSLRMEGQRLADRIETYRTALATLRHVETLQHWERQARTIGYIDEGYHAAKFWQAEWEQFQGDALTEQAQLIRRELEPLQGVPSNP